MPTPKLPKTVARLSTSITIRLIPEDTLNAATLANPAAILTSVQNAPIGAVESFVESNDRPASIRFEMNAGAPGVVQEVTPNQVNPRTVHLRRTVLYGSDALETFQIIGGDVVQQYKPFALIKVESSPEGSTDPTRITIYRGCWFTTNPKSYEIARGDLRIIQDMAVTYAEREIASI